MSESQLLDDDASVFRRLATMVRKFVVEISTGALWQLSGLKDEVDDGVPVYQPIGYWARARVGSTSYEPPEAIVLKVGDNENHPVVVAMRDEDLRRVHAAIRDMDFDEVAIFNSGAFVKITKDGDIILRAGTGREVQIDDGSGAVALATKADVDASETFLKAQFDTILGHTHVSLGAPPTAGTGILGTGFSVPSAAGTSVVKGK